jgi:hypothetical protein
VSGVDIDLDDARAQHGKLIRVDLYGREYVFRPMSVTEAQGVADRLDNCPSAALSTAISAVRACCLGEVALFDEAAENFPLAFSAEGGVCSTLLAMASDELAAQVKAAISRWRHSERQLGVVAEDLLAFKAYTGGTAGTQELAGALHWAEHLDYTKATYKLILGYMKAMAKRR